MSLAPGTRLGAYEILSLLGVGGMGEVYRARDTRLHRDVAIKVLPELFAADADRLARFKREAQVLASVNHPHIAAIYGLEESASGSALVLELVEGPTVADRIAHGPIPIDEALLIARQIADALEAAHEHGIIHRDLKPANIKLTADGAVKVLDFGLAKTASEGSGSVRLQPDLTASPTITSPAMTLAGVILGTAAYMSPEQAKGKPADKRSDIWAFGCVLYEMLTAKRAFSGDDVSDTLAAVLRGAPDWSALPRATPETLRKLLRRTLEKDRKRRLADIADARLEIDEAANDRKSSPSATARKLRIWQRPIAVLLAAATLVAASSLAVWSVTSSGSSPSLPVQRLSINLPASAPFNVLGRGTGLAISPDGTRLVYAADIKGTLQLYMRSLDQLEAHPLPGTEHGRFPFFSPDGEWVAFFNDSGRGPAENKLQKVSLRGGPPRLLCDAPNPRGGWWGTDGTIVFGSGRPGDKHQLFRISENGGAREPLGAPDPRQPARGWPQVLPGGRAVLFTARATAITRLEILTLSTGESRVIVENGHYGRYVPSGHLIYMAGGTLMALPFDIDRLETTGPAAPIIEGIQTDPLLGGASLAITPQGTLIYRSGAPSAGTAFGFGRLVTVGRDGVAAPVASSRGLEAWPRLSPDDTQVAVYAPVSDAQAAFEANADIWIHDLSRGTRQPITRDASQDDFPVWTPDGSRIVFHSTRSGSEETRRAGNLYWQRLDSNDPAEPLLISETRKFPGSWSPDGQVLAFHEINAQNERDISVLPRGGKPQSFLATPFNELAPSFSRDGRCIAYVSDESGERDVYIQPYPGPGRRIPISTDGGEGPVWSHDGRELFYFRPQSRLSGRLMVVDVKTERACSAGVPRPLFDGPYVTQGFGTPNYDVFRDGKRFVMVQPPVLSTEIETPLVIVLNWFEELKRLAPGRE